MPQARNKPKLLMQNGDAGEIEVAGGWRAFTKASGELSEWIDARAWTTGDGPKALFDAAVARLREQRVLLPGVNTLARKIFHGRLGLLYQRYHDGMEDQIGALGLVLNAVVLFNTRYMDAAVTQLRTEGFDVRDEDLARLSPFARHHINMLGRYSFTLPDLPEGLRPLGSSTEPADPAEY